MKVAMGQFTVQPVWQLNAEICVRLMDESVRAGCDLLVLPEGILARDITDPDIVLTSAQSLNGPFVKTLLQASLGNELTVMATIHIPAHDGRVYNVFITLRNGELLSTYRKLHLYDAFAMQESKNVIAGDEIPPLVEVAGLKVGLMTCYDVRFPELARRLVLDGAQVLALPAAWVRGPLKERHWELLTATRALENTCYVVAVGECGPRNIGNSMVIDPLGVVIAKAPESDALVFTEIDPQRIIYARSVLPVLENRRFDQPTLK